MKSTGRGILHPFKFNFDLFVVDGKPLKFSLVGYELRYSLAISKLIDTFGGEVTDPDVPGAIVLADPSHLSDSSYPRYYINYLYDCIVLQQLLHWTNYRQGEIITSYGIINDSESNKCNQATELSKDNQPGKNFTTLQSQELSNNPIPASELLADIIIPDEDTADDLRLHFSDSSNEEAEFSEDERSCFMTTPQYHDQDSHEWKFNEDSTTQVNDDNFKSKCERLQSCSSTGCSFISTVSQADISSTEHVQTPVTRQKLKRESSEQNGIKLNKMESENHNIFTPILRLRKKSTYSRWTNEQYETMINFLVNNDLIHRALTRTVWKQCLETSPILRKQNKSSDALYSKFCSYLRWNYANYTNDPKALKLFKKMEIKRRSPCKKKSKLK